VIGEDVFAVQPWAVHERELDLDLLAQTESILALSNGHIGLRANLDEGEPTGTPGTYLNAFYETRPLPHAEDAYGYPEDAQTLLNVTNGKIIRLLVDDEPFDIRYGELVRHERVLDFREGVLTREVEWISPAGQGIRLRSTRLVSFVQRAIAAIRYEVEPIDGAARIVVQSELVANEPLPEGTKDPRMAAVLENALVPMRHGHHGLRAGLVHRTRRSGLLMSAGMDHVVDGPEGTVTDCESEADLARVTVTTELSPGQRLGLVKLLAYGWSSRRTLPSVRDQVEAALSAAKRTGWDGLRASQRKYLDDVWDRADVELDGHASLQQAVRFSFFHVLQAAARAENRAIPAKGLTGRGYDGHSFWDMDTFTVPVLTYTVPDAAADALRWRHSTIDLAEARAHELRLQGAAFPWRTIRGQECSGYWPAGTAAMHINADIADAVRRYLAATEDEAFEEGPALDILVGTARLWRSVGHHDARGGFRIDGVTGPDEYHALGDNNAYTNLMAARNLRTAAELAFRHPQRAAELGVDEEEIASWRDAANAVVIPYDEEMRITAQAESFTRYRHWPFDETPADEYPLLLHYPYFLLYTSQVIKQADLVLALWLCGDQFDAEQKARDFDYYERITVRDSSLSACIQGIVAAEVGHLGLAFDYFTETSFIDLRDLALNTKDGVHLAALSGSWLVAVAGFGGMRDHGETLSFAPRLPHPLTRLAFRLTYRGRRLRVEVNGGGARYELLQGEPLDLLHHGEPFTLGADEPQELSVPPIPPRPAPPQPATRQPLCSHEEV
jgi:alpha,alpha-trehalose phosphorylase